MKHKTFEELIKNISEIENCYDLQNIGLEIPESKTTAEQRTILWKIYSVYYKQFCDKE